MRPRVQPYASRVAFSLMLFGLPLACGCRNQPPGVAGALPPSGAGVPEASAKPAVAFEDVTARSGIRHVITSGHEANQHGMIDFVGGGVAAFDFDLDGLCDLAMAGGGNYGESSLLGRPGAIYRGIEPFRFADVSAAADFDLSAYYNHGVICDDFNADGFDDLLATGYGGIQLLVNQGDGTFQDHGRTVGLVDEQWSTGAATFDLNNDGLLDLYVSHYCEWSLENNPVCHLTLPGSPRGTCAPKQFAGITDKLFVQSDGGTFEERGESLGVEPQGRGLGVVAGDFDGDRDTDVYVANDSDRNFYYINEDGKLREAATLKGCAADSAGVVQGSMGIAVGDYQGDGKPDLFVTNFSRELPALYENREPLGFRFATLPAGVRVLGEEQVSWGTQFADVDLDADQDLLVVSGHVDRVNPFHLQKSSYLENVGGKFIERSGEVGGFFTQPIAGRGMVTADFDADGLLDLAVTQLDAPSIVLRNASRPKHGWLQVRLVGTRSNRNAVGATAQLRDGSTVQTGWVHGGGSYLSTSQRLLHFAVPADRNDSPMVLHVTWPSGLEEDLEVSGAKRRLLVVEASDGVSASEVIDQ